MLQPTTKLRWLQVHMGDTRHHPTAIQIGDTLYAKVLQQWWECRTIKGDFHDSASLHVSDEGEWRDIPVEHE